MKISRKICGFTLIEVVIVIVLSGIIAAVASKMLAQGFSAYLAGKNITDADWQGRVAVERMTRDLRAIPSISSISAANATQLTYTDSDGNTVNYQLSGSTLTLNDQALANGVNSFTFSYFDSNGASTETLSTIRYIRIAMNITQTDNNYSLTTAVYPRNLS